MTDRYLQDQQNAIDIAKLQVEVKHLTDGMAEMTKVMQVLAEKVEAISETLTEAKGGWRMLMLVGGAAGSVGAFLSWVATHVSFKGAP